MLTLPEPESVYAERFSNLLRVLHAVRDQDLPLDMRGWVQDLVGYDAAGLPVSCGTATCAVGHACLDAWFRQEGLLLFGTAPYYRGYQSWLAVRAFFGIEPRDSGCDPVYHLFDADAYADPDWEGEEEYTPPIAVVIARVETYVESRFGVPMRCQIRHREHGIYQGNFIGLGFWHPMSDMPEQGFCAFPSYAEALAYVQWLCSDACDSPLRATDLTIESFDHATSERLIRNAQVPA